MTNNERITSSFFWKFSEAIGVQGVSFIITVVLARIISPKDYGLISLVTVFIAIALVFVQGGFNTALIQKKDASKMDYSSVLIFSIIVAMVLYILLFFFAPLISLFYNEKELISIIRVLSISLLFGAFNSIQIAYCSAKLQFKLIFISSLVGIVISGILGIITALNGGGVWSLVVQTISKDMIVCFTMLCISEWKPTLSFSFASVKELIPFGSRILITNLLITGFQNIRSLLIGKRYSSESLALYNRGNSFPQMIMSCISTTIQSVLLPVYSKVQEDKKLIKKMVRQSVRMSCFLIFPCMLGLFAVSDNLIIFLLTDVWIECSSFLKILCLSYIFFPIQLAPEQALRAMGLSKINLRIEMCRKLCEILLLIISLQFDVVWVAFSAVGASFLGYIIIIYPSSKNLDYSFLEQVNDMGRPLIMSILMLLVIYIIDFALVGLNSGIKLFIECIVGVISYVCLSIVSRNSEFKILFSKIKTVINK